MFKYSIIMPVFNSESTLEISINSVINQTYSNWELIVIDDGSTDNSFQILENFKEKDERIRIFKQENAGPGIARNNGINKSSGDYILFLDADDYYELDLIEKVNSLNEKSSQDLIFISMINEDKIGKVKNIIKVGEFSKYKKEDYLNMVIMGTLPWGPCSKIVKKDIIKDTLFLKLPVGEEIIYSYDIINKADKIAFIDKPLYHYVHNDSGQHTKGGIDPWCEVVITMSNYLKEKNIYQKHCDSVRCLALKALLISIYRISNSNSLVNARGLIRQKCKFYFNDFKLNKFSTQFLDKKSKILYILIRLKFYFILILFSKIRNIKK
ncbi:MAG: glycosyltransferase [Firmicutes bacterium]|nr:glycosyltransferase [Bacillota bacterium]